MRHIAIDTNVLCNAFNEQEPTHLHVVTLVPNSKIGIALDSCSEIRTEYERNVGHARGFQKWLKRLQERIAIKYVSGKLDSRHCAKLKSYGCHESTDHVFLAVARNADKVLITEDSDFGKGPKGSQAPHCYVLDYIQKEVGVRVFDVEEASRELHKSLTGEL